MADAEAEAGSEGRHPAYGVRPGGVWLHRVWPSGWQRNLGFVQPRAVIGWRGGWRFYRSGGLLNRHLTAI